MSSFKIYSVWIRRKKGWERITGSEDEFPPLLDGITKIEDISTSFPENTKVLIITHLKLDVSFMVNSIWHYPISKLYEEDSIDDNYGEFLRANEEYINSYLHTTIPISFEYMRFKESGKWYDSPADTVYIDIEHYNQPSYYHFLEEVRKLRKQRQDDKDWLIGVREDWILEERIANISYPILIKEVYK